MAAVNNSVPQVGECGDSTLTKITSAVGIVSFIFWGMLVIFSIYWWKRESTDPLENKAEGNIYPISGFTEFMLDSQSHVEQLEGFETLGDHYHGKDDAMERLQDLHSLQKTYFESRRERLQEARDRLTNKWWRRAGLDEKRNNTPFNPSYHPPLLVFWYRRSLEFAYGFLGTNIEKSYGRELHEMRIESQIGTTYLLILALAQLRYGVLTPPSAGSATTAQETSTQADEISQSQSKDEPKHVETTRRARKSNRLGRRDHSVQTE